MIMTEKEHHKHKEAEKADEPKKDEPAKAAVKEHKKEKTIKEHLHTKVPVPIYIVIGVALMLLMLFVFRVPYQAKESYIDLETYTETYMESVEDTSVPPTLDCPEIPAPVRIRDNYTYIKPSGLNDYICYATFKVENQANTGSNWTYRYVFNINGMDFPTEPQTYRIDKSPASKTFVFESDLCEKDDRLFGHHELISGPIVQSTDDCVAVPKMIEVERTRTATREVPKERLVQKTESIWQLILGVNKGEKA
jgi:hypothetical protein